LSAPNKPPPTFANVFSFAQDTIAVIDTLARGTGARHEPLLDWQAEAAHTAARFWNVWKWWKSPGCHERPGPSWFAWKRTQTHA